MLLPEIDDPWFEKLPIEFPPTVHKNHLSINGIIQRISNIGISKSLNPCCFSFCLVCFFFVPVFLLIFFSTPVYRKKAVYTAPFLIFYFCIHPCTSISYYWYINMSILFSKTVISNITCFFYICGSFLIILYGIYFRNSTSPPLIRRHRFFTAIAPIRYCPCITCVQYV